MEKSKVNNKVQELVRKFRQLYSYISCEASAWKKQQLQLPTFRRM